MEVKEIVFAVVQILISIILIGVVLMQSGKSSGLSGSIAGGAESFFGKNKGRTIDALLDRWTSIVAMAFALFSMVYVMFM